MALLPAPDVVATARAVVAAGHGILQGVVDRACRGAEVAVVDRVATAEAAALACRLRRPDVLIVDLDLPDVDGFRLLSDLGDDRPPAVLVLADRPDDELVLRGLQLGARGFVTKADGLRDLDDTIRRVASGERVVPPHLEEGALRALGRLARRAREGAAVAAQLSRRQRQVLQLLSEGLTVRQAASRLGLSPRTVESHVGELYSKLGVRTRLQAVSRAARLGLVDL
jgi:DNA-binding NarL/FixJ family response regulator